jgi:hypothetical protein
VEDEVVMDKITREEFRARCTPFAFVPHLFSELYAVPDDAWLDGALARVAERVEDLDTEYNGRFLCASWASLYADLLRLEYSHEAGWFRLMLEPDHTLACGVAILQAQTPQGCDHAVLAVLSSSSSGWRFVDVSEGGPVAFELGSEWAASHFITL